MKICFRYTDQKISCI